MSPEEIRGKLLGPAIGIALTAVLGLLSIGGLGLALMLDEEFHRDIQAGGANNPGEVFFAYLILVVVGFLIMVPSLVSLIGAWAMFRGRGLVAAWSGAIATILPCGACWPFSIAFAIWAMVVLSDSRVQTGMK